MPYSYKHGFFETNHVVLTYGISDFSSSFLKIPRANSQERMAELDESTIVFTSHFAQFFFARKKITHHNLGAAVFHGPKVLGARHFISIITNVIASTPQLATQILM